LFYKITAKRHNKQPTYQPTKDAPLEGQAALFLWRRREPPRIRKDELLYMLRMCLCVRPDEVAAEAVAD